MAFLTQVQIYCFLFSYLTALAAELAQLFKKPASTLRFIIVGFTAAGFIAHTSYLLARARSAGLPPLLSSQQDWLLVLAWLGSLLYLILLLTRQQLAIGVFILPAVLVLVVSAEFASSQSAGSLREAAQRRWGMFHVTSLVLGVAAVAGAALSGLMYLLHHQRLRARSGWLQRLALPSLEHLTTINRWMVILSVPCLTIGLITGFLLIALRQNTHQQPQIPWNDPAIITTIVVWICAIAVLIRVLRSSRQTGRSVAQLSFLSGALLLLAILGLTLLSGRAGLNTIHGGPPSNTPIPPATPDSPAPVNTPQNTTGRPPLDTLPTDTLREQSP
jgi:ABC-type transport system involved in cytochrome c biogenesis permease subunit